MSSATWTGRRHPSGDIVGRSAAIRRLLARAAQFGPTTLSVMLIGETGTGKELFAREIHRQSGRAGPLVDVNVAAIPRDLFEGELFGHRRGAFTGAVTERDGLTMASNGGTLFLDETTSLPYEMQGKLLRVLDTGEVRRVGDTTKRKADLRVVAACDTTVAHKVDRGEFRSDLYHRLTEVVLNIPPLRERPEDIAPIARYYAERGGKILSPEGIQFLESAEWPGNVRQLKATVKRAVHIARFEQIDQAVLREAFQLGRQNGAEEFPELRFVKDDPMSRSRLLELCRSLHWRTDEITQAMGVSRATFFRRMRALGLSVPRGGLGMNRLFGSEQNFP